MANPFSPMFTGLSIISLAPVGKAIPEFRTLNLEHGLVGTQR
jgi:hypothetical protein